jgi:hypothetical protein
MQLTVEGRKAREMCEKGANYLRSRHRLLKVSMNAATGIVI